MKLTLPLGFEDITIEQIMKHGEREISDFEKVLIYGQYTADELKKMPYQLIEAGARHIDELLANPARVHNNMIQVNGEWYGFIPDWEQFSTGEYIDMEEFSKDLLGNATKIMSILYRPVTRMHNNICEIEPYKGTQNHKMFAQVSAQEFYGAMLFFSNTRKELAFVLAQSLARETTKLFKKRSHRSGGGITLLSSWRKAICSKFNRLLNYLSRKS